MFTAFFFYKQTFVIRYVIRPLGFAHEASRHPVDGGRHFLPKRYSTSGSLWPVRLLDQLFHSLQEGRFVLPNFCGGTDGGPEPRCAHRALMQIHTTSAHGPCRHAGLKNAAARRSVLPTSCGRAPLSHFPGLIPGRNQNDSRS